MAVSESYTLGRLEAVDGFGKRRLLADDLLHDESRRETADEALNETQYFGFHVPEHAIGFFGYLRVHNNLEQATTCAIGWRGTKPHITAAELLDVRNYQSTAFLKSDLHGYVSPSSYSVTMEEPGRRFRQRFDDPTRQNHVDVTFEATMESVVWPTEHHLDQIMRARGDIVLRGTRYPVDCLVVRDRSWSELRPEYPRSGPPSPWMNGAFGEQDGFCVTLADDPARDPVWKDMFDVDPEQCLKSGWVSRDGRPAFIREASKLTHYPDRRSMYPAMVEMNLIDALGRRTTLRGTPVAASPVGSWVNLRTIMSIMRWERDDGAVCHGVSQEAQFSDFINATLTYDDAAR